MDFWELTKLLVRRWYFSVPMLVLSVASAVFAGASVKPDYKADIHLQLIPPVSAVAPTPGKPHNPWNDLGVAAIGNAAIIRVQDKDVLDGLVADGYTDNFTVTLDQRSPIIIIEAIGNSPKQATGTAQSVMKIFQQSIDSLQKPYGAPQDQLITTHSLDTGANIQTVTSKVKRALAVIGGVGLLLTTASTIGLDALLRRRSARRGEPQPSDLSAAPVSPGGRPEGNAESVTRRIRTSTVRRRVPSPAVYQSEEALTQRNGASPAIPRPREFNGPPAGAATNSDVESTIVLPVPAKDYWGNRGDKGKRS